MRLTLEEAHRRVWEMAAQGWMTDSEVFLSALELTNHADATEILKRWRRLETPDYWSDGPAAACGHKHFITLHKPLLNVSRRERYVSLGYWSDGQVVPIVSMDARDWLLVAGALIRHSLRSFLP